MGCKNKFCHNIHHEQFNVNVNVNGEEFRANPKDPNDPQEQGFMSDNFDYKKKTSKDIIDSNWD
eukprot:CAMPEP_0116908666 /NCGR_PEP_ID=MMETSP0467-20121206/13826_1 /TAXON_ID=283647 /ORGANISM="Mesodinium pulex, Strain SPMC105" /LENGTH=63 /DNA_ID=CAMNT_0004583897 /DNA_START=306 /DNA_END=497 /DNA_ORIENTATION=+